jgi:hypothetical protein
MPRICSACHDWLLEDFHKFCGNCGAYVGQYVPVLSMSAETKAITIRQDSQCKDTNGPDFIVETSVLGGRSVYEDKVASIARLALVPGTGISCTTAMQLVSDPKITNLCVRVLAKCGTTSGRTVPVPQAGTILVRQSPPKLSVNLSQYESLDIGTVLAAPKDPKWRYAGIEIINEGGSVVLKSARLRIQRSLGIDQDIPDAALPHPIVLTGNSTTEIEAAFTATEADRLSSLMGKMCTGLLELTFESDDPDARPVILGPFKIGKPRPAAPHLIVRESKDAPKIRVGRRGRIPCGLENNGTEHFIFEDIKCKFILGAGQDLELDIETPSELGAAVGGGEMLHLELRPLIPPDQAPTATGTLEIEAKVKTEHGRSFTLVKRVAVEIVSKDRALKGFVCIDFGTSESAAAVLFETSTNDQSNAPLIIELGKVAVREKDPSVNEVAARFLETTVLKTEVGEKYLVGKDTKRVIDAIASRQFGDVWPQGVPRARVLQDFKLRLSAASTGEERQEATEAAAAFLTYVRGLIEDHPAVAAQITDQTKVVATRPRMWDSGQTARLKEAFSKAGLGTPTIRLNNLTETLLPESWPPFMFALVGAQRSETGGPYANLDSSGDLVTSAFLPIETRLDEKGYLLIADIGAGTGDYSLIELTVQRPTQIVRELAFYTDKKFVGRSFESLIARCLCDWAWRDWKQSGGSGLNQDDFNRHIGGTDDSNPKARAAFLRAVQAIQYEPGLFHATSQRGETRNQNVEVRATFDNYLRLAGDFKPKGDKSDSKDRKPDTETEARKNFTELLIQKWYGKGEPLRGTAINLLPLELGELPDGKRVALELDGSWNTFAVQLIDAFLLEFEASLKNDLEQVFQRGQIDVSQEREQKNNPNRRSVRSGRGGAFPLADMLLIGILEQLVGSTWTRAVVPPAASKSITSWGGAWFAPQLSDPDNFDFTFEWGASVEGENTAPQPEESAVPFIRWNSKPPFGKWRAAPTATPDVYIVEMAKLFETFPGIYAAPTRAIALHEEGALSRFIAPSTRPKVPDENYLLVIIVGSNGAIQTLEGTPDDPDWDGSSLNGLVELHLVPAS